ncbi:MAG: HAMP domain-containing histidine kinase [Nitrospirales bacterium]|nr:HAMP domain-containing histidine kinase [Nitrospirales bacterium]
MKGLFLSIQGRLFLWLAAFTSLLMVGIGVFLYYEVRSLVCDSLDRTLHSKMQIVRGLLHIENGAIELELSEVISGEYSTPRSGHYYKVMMDGRALAASPSLADEDFTFARRVVLFHGTPGEGTYDSTGPDKEPVRVLRNDFSFLGRDASVYVAESLVDSLNMIGMFRRVLFIVVPASIVVVCLVGLCIVRRSIRPLKAFSTRIEAITHKTMGERINTANEVKELVGLAGSFNAMLDRLQRAFESQRRLVSDASHELKTPVTVIKSQCDVVLRKERTGEEYREALATVQAVAGNMIRLVRSLLSLARLDSGMLAPVDFRPVVLKECMRDAVALVMPLADKKRIALRMDIHESLLVSGDRERLIEAFLNIVDNAVKYNREGGRVEITALREGAMIQMKVVDTGIGIKEENRAKIFERFYRENTAGDAEGTGLGLSIAKTILEAHGGEIRVASEQGKGSAFSMILPDNGSP